MPQYGGRERGNMKRVVITGLGTVNPLGSTVEKFWENIKKGTLGVSKIDSFDTTELGVSVAGIIRDFDPAEYFDRKDIRHMERFTQIAVASAIQALQDAGTDFKDMDPYRVGTIIGCGIGGIGRIEEEHDKYRAKGPGRISPFFVPLPWHQDQVYQKAPGNGKGSLPAGGFRGNDRRLAPQGSGRR